MNVKEIAARAKALIQQSADHWWAADALVFLHELKELRTAEREQEELKAEVTAVDASASPSEEGKALLCKALQHWRVRRSIRTQEESDLVDALLVSLGPCTDNVVHTKEPRCPFCFHVEPVKTNEIRTFDVCRSCRKIYTITKHVTYTTTKDEP